MANKEHLAILERGVAEWNEWRKQHPDIGPKLREANLRGAKLFEANLNHADLSGSHPPPARAEARFSPLAFRRSLFRSLHAVIPSERPPFLSDRFRVGRARVEGPAFSLRVPSHVSSRPRRASARVESLPLSLPRGTCGSRGCLLSNTLTGALHNPPHLSRM